MPKLPPALASDLSKSIGMPPPPDNGADDMGDDSDSMSEMDHCISDVADAIVSGDKDQIMSSLKDLFEAAKEEDSDQDSSEP
jgi:hypothetical protein